MGEIIAIIGFLKDAPALVTSAMAIFAIAMVVWLRLKDADISSATSISKTQNEKLLALMEQNDKLLKSVSSLQSQVQSLHDQMNDDANEYRNKMEQTYKVIDDMRIRISELEDLVRKYQNIDNHCNNFGCARRTK